jgi:hypothetical protein
MGQWTEEYKAPVEQEHEKWAKKLVQDFNDHLRQGEFRRHLVSVEVFTGEGEKVPTSGHDWEKVGGVYMCKTCGVTGRRRGQEWPPVRDKPYRGRFFASCDVAREYMPLTPEERMLYRNRILGRERSERLWHERSRYR